MNEEFENIDQLFREKLWNIEETPPQKVWRNIEVQLGHRKKNKTKVLFFRIAAGLLLLISTSIGIYYFQQRNESSIISEQQNTTPDKVQNKAVTNPDKTGENATDIITAGTSNNITKVAKTIQDNQTTASTVEENTSENATGINEDHTKIASIDQPIASQVENTDNTATEDSKIKLIKQPSITANFQRERTTGKITIPNLTMQQKDDFILSENKIAGNDNITVSKNNNNKDWIIGGQVAPLYAYRDISTKNLSANTLKKDINSEEEGIVSYAGGLNIKYAANRRLSLQSGIYYSKMGQTIHATQIYNAIIPLPSSSFSNNYESVSNVSSTANTFQTARAPLLNPDNKISAKHYYEYLEIPFIVRYKFIDRTIDFDILGGISTNFLLDDNLHFDQDINTSNYFIPSENKLTRINYSGSLGFGIEYPITSRFIFNVEPVFKYYLNSINANSNINKYPYSFGIYTGMSYAF